MDRAGSQNAECRMKKKEFRILSRIPNLPCPIGPPHPAEAGPSFRE
jgi:hypothetical protein